MAANTGVALGLLLRPETYSHLSTSTLTRDAVIRAILSDAEPPSGDAPAIAATTLRAHLAGSDSFTPAEAALMDEWLERIQNLRRGRTPA